MGTANIDYYSISNYVRWSEAFSTWIDGFVNVSNQGYDYFGDPIATKLVERVSYSWHYIQESPTNFFNDDYTFSIYAKAEEREHIKLISSWPGPYEADAIFDLVNGTVEGDGSMDAIGDGWYRCSVTSQVINDLMFNVRVMICMRDEQDNILDDYEGDGKSGLLVFGAMFNIGLDAEAYVKTQGNPV